MITFTRHKLLIGVIAGLPILLYYFFVSSCAVNIPLMDDYDAILGFANNFFFDFSNKLGLLFSQHNEHRFLLGRSLTVLSYFLTGNVNFKTLIIIGNLSLLAFIAVVFVAIVFSGKKIKPFYFLPVCFLLFHPLYWEVSLMAIAALATLAVYFFVFSSLYLLNWPERKYFITALFVAILATFINGNGMFVFPCGLLILWFYKRYKDLLFWLLGSILTVGLYFIGYSRLDSAGSIVRNPMGAIKFFFYFISSSLAPLLSTELPFRKEILLSVGALLSLYFLFLFRKIRTQRVNITTITFIVYLLISALFATLRRAGFGEDYAFSNRYALYSSLFIIFTYISLVEFLSERNLKIIFPILLASGIIFNIYSYIKIFPNAFSNKLMVLRNLADWQKNNESCLFIICAGLICPGMHHSRLLKVQQSTLLTKHFPEI